LRSVAVFARSSPATQPERGEHVVERAEAYLTVSMFSAALDERYAIALIAAHGLFGSAAGVVEPRPLDTLTTTGAGDRSRRGRKA
jgi:hypothetical protein